MGIALASMNVFAVRPVYICGVWTAAESSLLVISNVGFMRAEIPYVVRDNPMGITAEEYLWH